MTPEHRELIRTMLKTHGTRHVVSALADSGIYYSFERIDGIRRVMQKAGERARLPVRQYDPFLGMPADVESARKGSAMLLKRQLETGQCNWSNVPPSVLSAHLAGR